MIPRLALAFALVCCSAFAGEQPYRIAGFGGLFTDVTINGKGPFSFLVDTGASNSLIYEHTRQALGLVQSQPGQLTVYGVNDVATAMPVRPGELRVAGEAVRDLTMGVLPDTRADLGDGVLGLDVLERYFVVLDRQGMRLRLLPPGSAATRPYRDWTDAEITMRPLRTSRAHFWYLSLYFERSRFPTLLDLGASATMINWNAAAALGVRRSDYAAQGPPPANLQDLLGNTAPALRLMNIHLGVPGRRWDHREVIIADAPAFGYFGLADQPAAVIGPGLLRDDSLAIDFGAGRLYLGPTEKH